MSNDDFAERAARLQDEDLIKIAFSKEEEGFLPEMVSAAQSEITKRKIPLLDIEIEKEKIEKENEYLGNEKDEPLSDLAWLGFFLFGGIMIASITIAAIFFFNGHHKKAKQAVGGIVAGLIFWWILIFVLSLFLR